MDKKMKPLTNETYVFCVQPTELLTKHIYRNEQHAKDVYHIMNIITIHLKMITFC